MSQRTIRSGLLSVTFRKLSPEEILELASQAGLASIEWGGDVHVPHGELELATELGSKTREAGLSVSAYGSYYRFEHDAQHHMETSLVFTDVLNTACALGTSIIRIWAGTKGSDICPTRERDFIIGRTREIASEAAEKNVKIAFEYHGNTLTDEIASTMRFFEKVDHPNVFSFWQPAVGLSKEKRLQDLAQVLPILANVHVFHWGQKGGSDRRDLEEGRDEWAAYIQRIRDAGKDPWFGLEFVKEDSQEQLLRDAAVLNALL